jgi:hypothetical protein
MSNDQNQNLSETTAEDGAQARLRPASSKPSRAWVFTHNNYDESDVDMYTNWEKKYMVLGREVSETGTPHLQGFIIFSRTYRLTQVKKLSPRAHWEVAKALDAGNYCMKDKNYIKQDFRTPGKRNDLVSACEIVQTRGINALKKEMPYVFVKYPNGFAQIIPTEPRRFKPEVYWLWGKTGTGKTRSVLERETDLWVSGDGLKWWDGYEGQEATLFDDFRAEQCAFHWLLRLLDRTPCRVQVKGGTRELTAKRMYITSAYPPDEAYALTSEDRNQLHRRITDVIEFKVGMDPPIFAALDDESDVLVTQPIMDVDSLLNEYI